MGQTFVEYKKVDVSSTFIENIFRSGLTLVSSRDCFCHNDKNKHLESFISLKTVLALSC